MKILRIFLIGSIVICVAGCETSGSKKKSKSGSDGFSSSESRSSSKQDDSAYISSKRITLVQSLTNNPNTSQTISSSKASSQVKRLPSSSKDKTTLEGRLTAQRISKASFASVLATAKAVARIEMKKGANRHINDAVKLDLALSAIASRKYSMANYYLSELKSSKIPKIRAAALNTLGVIALNDDRIPEAVGYFKKALKAVGSYKAAKLNLGFTALKGGDSGTAKRALGGYSGDWFVDYGLISVARLTGDKSKASSLCDRVLSKRSSHKAALFNCGLHNAQAKKDYTKAKNLINKASSSRGGESGWATVIANSLREVGSAAGSAPKKSGTPKAKKSGSK
jgi:tetratricopeptide (TPR) repeat protein